MSSSFVSMKKGVPGAKGDPGQIGGVDNFIDSLIEDRAPSQAAVFNGLAMKQDAFADSDAIKEGMARQYFTSDRARAACVDNWIDPELSLKAPSQAAVAFALRSKQDKIDSSDQISEGQTNKYFSVEEAQNAALAICPNRTEMMIALGKKQNAILSSDEIKEGSKNLYLTQERVFQAIAHDYVTRKAMESRLVSKQDVLATADDLAEGAHNKYYTDDRVAMVVSAALVSRDYRISQLQYLMDQQQKLIADMQSKLLELERRPLVLADGMVGATGSFMGIRSISAAGVTYQSFSVEGGLIKDISAETAVKRVP